MEQTDQPRSWHHHRLDPYLPPHPPPACLPVCMNGQGDFRDLRLRGLLRTRPLPSMLDACRCCGTWVLALQYALSFGVEVRRLTNN